MCVWSRSCVCSGFEEARCVRGVGGVCALALRRHDVCEEQEVCVLCARPPG